MPISNPTQLVDAYKKSGEFDRLRRELLASFQRDDAMSSFMNRVEDIARKKLETDQKLHLMPPDTVQRELLQELDRYPIVERAVADARVLSDQTSGIRTSVQKILREDRGNGRAQPQNDDLKPTQMRSSMPEGPSVIRKVLNSGPRPEKSLPNSRSQSPDSMKMSTPEPPDSPAAPTPNGITSDVVPSTST